MIPRSRSEALASIEKELASERASALRRIATTLEGLLSRLAALEAELVSAADRAPRLAAHEALRREAERYLWYLVVQREAIGLRRHDEVYEVYKVPRPLKP